MILMFCMSPDGGGGMEIVMERVYKAMKSVGSFNIVIGILLIVGGIASGTAIIVKGANLLRKKSDILF